MDYECTWDYTQNGAIGNVIFLDIDGVINNLRSLKFGELIDIECVRHVKRICVQADAHIVVSSSWRIGLSTDVLCEILSPWGLHRVIGRTSTDPACKQRGDEIKQWIEKFGCKNYLILDDDRDMLQEQMENFINTDGMVGITEEQSTDAIRRVFGVNNIFCPECNGYGRIDYDICGSCNGKILLL